MVNPIAMSRKKGMGKKRSRALPIGARSSIRRSVLGSALRVTIPYLALGSAWILFSDRLLLCFTDDPARMIALSTAKGWLFILVTALFLFFLVYNEFRRQTAMDSKLREGIAEKGALLAELNHRVKNNLQIISSILNLEAEGIVGAEARELNDRTRVRIRSITLAHERLFESDEIGRVELGSYLRGLWAQLGDVYSVNKTGAAFELGEIWAGPDEALPFGLFAAEAITNAIRYGIGTDGNVSVSIGLRSPAPGFCELTVRDEGPGFPEGKPGLGMRLMDALAQQLHGKLLLLADGGAVVSLVFPLIGGKNG